MDLQVVVEEPRMDYKTLPAIPTKNDIQVYTDRQMRSKDKFNVLSPKILNLGNSGTLLPFVLPKIKSENKIKDPKILI